MCKDRFKKTGIFNYCGRGQGNDLYIHSLRSFHGVVRNYLCRGTTLPFLPLVFAVPPPLYGPVVRVLGYRSGGPGSIPGTTRKKKVVGLERGAFSLVSTTEELLDRKVAADV
jgi:hypothetical protein